ncbi:MAG: hypothetical protein HC917_11820 [Richelia sp. SM2_1_7]|nr:hypothetical protein [Richelia sp. SM2_1_7]
MKTRGQLSFMYMEDKLVANRGFCPRIKAGAVRELQSRSGSIMFLYQYFQLSGKIIAKVT